MNHESHWINTYQHLCRTEKPVQSPIIGITGNFGSKGCELAPGYYQSVFQGGATPLVIPPLEDIGDIEVEGVGYRHLGERRHDWVVVVDKTIAEEFRIECHGKS